MEMAISRYISVQELWHTHMNDIFKNNDLKTSDFYPLRMRPFGYLNVYAPCNVSA